MRKKKSLKYGFVLLIATAVSGCWAEITPTPLPQISQAPTTTMTIITPPNSIAIPSLSPTVTPTPTVIPSFQGIIAILSASRIFSSIALLDLKTGTIQNFTETGADSISWSSDGSWLAFDSAFPSDEQHDIYKISSSGSELVRLTNKPQYETDLAWSPDGNFIAYSYWNGIALISADGLVSSVITSSEGYQRFPTWSPDGKQVAYMYLEKYGAPRELRIMDANGTNDRLVKLFPFAYGTIDWSPDGKWIVLISGTEPEECGDIYTIRPDGSDLTRLTELSGCATEAVWSPDGKYLAYVGRNKAHGNVMTWGWQVYIMDFASKNTYAVTNEQDWMIFRIDWSYSANSK